MHDRGVFMISVAAELAEMHPQTLRMYESRGLIEPKRSPKGTRLYSQADVERLRRIQEMTTEWGMNLAGVERVFALEDQLERMQRKVTMLERRAEQLQEEIARLEAEARVGQGRDRALRSGARHFTDPYSARAPAGVAHSASCSAEASRWCVASLMSSLRQADDDHAVRRGVEREAAAGHRAGDLPGVAAGVAQVDRQANAVAVALDLGAEDADAVESRRCGRGRSRRLRGGVQGSPPRRSPGGAQGFGCREEEGGGGHGVTLPDGLGADHPWWG